MRKLTHKEQVEVIVKINPNIEVLGEVINSRTPVLCRCKTCNHEWKAKPNHLKNGKGCPKCGGKMKLTHEEQIAAISKINPDIEVLGETVNNSTKVRCRCKICDHEWEATPHNLKAGYGCARCAGNRRLTHEEQVAAISRVNPSVEVLGEIVNTMTKVLCRCKVCNYKWEARPYELKKNKGCPRCAKHGFLRHDIGKLYVMVDDLEVPTIMKIGVSVRVEERRKKILRSIQKVEVGVSSLYIAKTWEGATEDMLALESILHQTFASYKTDFPTKFDGYSEFFYYRPEVFEEVEKLLT